MSRRRCSTSSSGPDRHRLDLLLLPDHVLQGRAELDGKPPVGNEYQSYHWKIKKLRPAPCAPPLEKRAIMTMSGPSARGCRWACGQFCSAVTAFENRLLEARILGFAVQHSQEREGVLTGRDRKSRQDDPGDFRNGGFRAWAGALNRLPQDRQRGPPRPTRLERNLADSKAANLDQTRERVGRRAPAGVRSQLRRGRGRRRQGGRMAEPRYSPALNQRKREPGLSGPGGAADQHGAWTDQNRRGVDSARLVHAAPDPRLPRRRFRA